MDECFRCGALGEKVRLYDAISGKGIVKICSECNAIEKLPIIKKPTDNQIADSQRQKSVRDMLTGMNRGKLLAGREVSLRELVDRNLKAKQIQSHPDLIENFHWTIQRIRRNRKITREQFSKGIGESEATVRMIEQGVLPENNYKIISKIESYLGVTLRKAGTTGFPNTETREPTRRFGSPIAVSEPPRRLGFDRDSASQLKIADLKEMKKKQEDGKQEISHSLIKDKREAKKPIDSWEEEYSEDDEKFLDKQDEDFFDEEGEK